jgi:hypothetical protein
MQPIYNQQGQVTGWLDSGGDVRDLMGRAIGFLNGSAVHAYGTGRHVGHFDDGFIRDRSGYAAAFISGASSGPTTPIPQIPPIPPVPHIAPIRPIPHTPGVPGIPHLSWSAQGWDGLWAM